jgi:hypothetical protein
MNAEEYATYRQDITESRYGGLGVVNVGDHERTLAYGYTTDRDTWHAYVMDGELHVLVYPYKGAPLGHLHGPSLDGEVLRPNKRVYPDTVDPLFARLMAEIGFELPFLGNFDFGTPDALRRAEMGPFKGKTHYDFA